MYNNDFNLLLKDYENLYKFMIKESADCIPNFAIIYLDKLSKYVEKTFQNNVEKKNLSKNKAQTLNKLRAKIRKCSEFYQEKLNLYNENPDDFKDDRKKDMDDDEDDEDNEEDDEEEEEDEEEQEDQDDDNEDEKDQDDDEDGKGKKKLSSKTKSKKGKEKKEEKEDYDDDNDEEKEDEADDDNDDDDDDSDDWSYSEDDNYASDEEDDKTKNAMSKWGLKTSTKVEKKKTVKQKKVKKESTKKEEKANRVVEDSQSAKNKGYAELLSTKNLTEDVIRERVKLVIEKRGRKGLDKHEHINILSKLCEIAKTISTQSYIEVLEHLINLEFDVVSSVYTYKFSF